MFRIDRKAILWTFCLIVAMNSTEALADGGTLLGTSTLLNSGDTAEKLDLVFIGDGFTSDQQGQFNGRVAEAVDAFLDAHPLQALRSAFNIHRVNVASPESGTDKFSTCGGESTGDSDVSRRTALDSGYCAGGSGSVYRCMFTSDSTLALGFAASAPDDDVVIVLVNDSGHGGCAAGGLTFLTLTSRFDDIVIHELGHALFMLADEYNYDGPDRFTGPEPGRVNITAETNRTVLKWNDLVLSGTAIPTQDHPDCSDSALPSRNVDADLVGTFESASYSRCDIYRPQYSCRMRTSDQQFCSVCRRKIIRDLADHLSSDHTVTFNELLVRRDKEPWWRGKGEIYMHYALRANAQQISGRWPASGTSKFSSGQSKNINVFAGVLPEPAPGTSAAIDLRVREADWPDSDDTLASDLTENLPASGSFELDRADYRLRGEVRRSDLRVLLDTLNVKDDHDGFFGGRGDIYVRYTISNGSQTVRGRWPSTGTRGMNDHDSAHMKTLAASIPTPSAGNSLTIRVRVMDADGFLLGGDDLIGDDTFTFGAGSAFGVTGTVHVRDEMDYRITFSVASGS